MPPFLLESVRLKLTQVEKGYFGYDNNHDRRPPFLNRTGGRLIGLLQRVSHARVEVDGDTVGAIGHGLLVLVGVERGDTEAQADRLLERLLGYRVFADEAGKMNLDVRQVGGGLLLVPQFTLPADTRKGSRPSFTPAAEPAEGRRLFDYLLGRAQAVHAPVGSGQFGADMQVSLTNDGPVTFWLQVAP